MGNALNVHYHLIMILYLKDVYLLVRLYKYTIQQHKHVNVFQDFTELMELVENVQMDLHMIQSQNLVYIIVE
jgi:hypothetical protein